MRMTYREHMQAAARQYWDGVLLAAKNNITHAARMAGVHRSYVYKALAGHGVRFCLKRGKWN